MNNIYIDNLTKSDYIEVKHIYNEGIKTKKATFETKVPSWAIWDKNHIKTCRLTIRTKQEILGWAAVSLFSKREVYSGVGEVSIYIKEAFRNEGLGKKLLKELINKSEEDGFWTLQSKIFTSNKKSIKLHIDCGFTKVGIRKALGKIDNKWQDIMLLEKRSKKIGINQKSTIKNS